MELFFKYAWVMFIAITIANGLFLKYQSKKYIEKNPELKEGYEDYFRGWLFYGNIPWVIMMIGSLGGMTQSIFDFFNPKSMNPIVLAFHLSIIILWAMRTCLKTPHMTKN